jgi:hypothetical protein
MAQLRSTSRGWVGSKCSLLPSASAECVARAALRFLFRGPVECTPDCYCLGTPYRRRARPHGAVLTQAQRRAAVSANGAAPASRRNGALGSTCGLTARVRERAANLSSRSTRRAEFACECSDTPGASRATSAFAPLDPLRALVAESGLRRLVLVPASPTGEVAPHGCPARSAAHARRRVWALPDWRSFPQVRPARWHRTAWHSRTKSLGCICLKIDRIFFS